MASALQRGDGSLFRRQEVSVLNVVNKNVKHSCFGTGSVTAQTETSIEVQFSPEYGVKKFVYPDAFETHLKLCDADMQEEMVKELKSLKEQASEENKKLAEEDTMRREAARRTLLEQKRATIKRRNAAAKKAAAKKTEAASEK